MAKVEIKHEPSGNVTIETVTNHVLELLLYIHAPPYLESELWRAIAVDKGVAQMYEAKKKPDGE